MTDPHKSGSVTRISVNFYTIKGAKECMEIILMVFPKKILFGHKSSTFPGSTLRTIFKFCSMKRAKMYKKIIVFEKDLVCLVSNLRDSFVTSYLFLCTENPRELNFIFFILSSPIR